MKLGEGVRLTKGHRLLKRTKAIVQTADPLQPLIVAAFL